MSSTDHGEHSPGCTDAALSHSYVELHGDGRGVPVVAWLSVVRLGVIPCALVRHGVLVGEAEGAWVSSVSAVNVGDPEPRLRTTADFGVSGTAETWPRRVGMTS